MAVGILAAAVVVPTFRRRNFVAGLGITSVVVGFAFEDTLQNFRAGVVILMRRPFVVGDQLRSKELERTVEESSTRSTRLETYDGGHGRRARGPWTVAVRVGARRVVGPGERPARQRPRGRGDQAGARRAGIDMPYPHNVVLSDDVAGTRSGGRDGGATERVGGARSVRDCGAPRPRICSPYARPPRRCRGRSTPRCTRARCRRGPRDARQDRRDRGPP